MAETKTDPPKTTTSETVSTNVQVASGLVTTVASGSGPQSCPRPDWSSLPQFDRNVPIFLFGAACLPGTATAAGCPSDKSFYTIAVPVNQFIAEGWEAPGGNRYWAKDLTVNLKDPKVVTLLNLLARRSKDKFTEEFGGSKRNTTMASVLATGKWVAKYGVMTVENSPTAATTAGECIQRGSYLLNVDDISKGVRLQAYGSQPWMGSKVKQVELWASYNPGANNLNYTIRVVFDGAWSQTVNSANAWLQNNTSKVCGKISGTEMTAAAVTMTAFPGTQPYAAAYAAAMALCRIPFSPPACVPQAPVPGQVTIPTTFLDAKPILQSVKGGTVWSTGITIDPSMGMLAPTRIAPGAVPTTTTTYPAGTIAWYDAGVGGYRVAIPYAGDGVTHIPISAGALSRLPAEGIMLVDKTGWEKATLPWLRRSTTKIGMMVAGVALAAAATAIASRED